MIELQKVNILSKENHEAKTGGAHFHVFIDNKTGEELIERTTAEIHSLMKGPNGAQFNPVKPGYTWSYTYGTYEYDTPDGVLQEGQYAEDGEKAVCRFSGMKETEVLEVDLTKINSGKISETDVAEVKENFSALNTMYVSSI